jgi:hypothetical protein
MPFTEKILVSRSCRKNHAVSARGPPRIFETPLCVNQSLSEHTPGHILLAAELLDKSEGH